MSVIVVEPAVGTWIYLSCMQSWIRGDGTCKYLSGNLCSIYEKRPLLCRVDESYQKFFKEVMPIDTYYRLNREACQRLKNLEK